MSYKAAIVIVAYNRVKSLKRLLKQVGNAVYLSKDIPLVISIDHCETNQEVISCAEKFQWKHGPKYIRTHEKNMGLKRHILECGDYALQYGSIILLEDDLLVAPYYYEYAKTAQECYGQDERIAGISLYGHVWNANAVEAFCPLKKDGDVYFGQFSCTWGQSWTKRQWSSFREWYGRHPELIENGHLPAFVYTWKESWGKHFLDYIVETNRFYVVPYASLSTVFDEVGVHSKYKHLQYQAPLYIGETVYRFVDFEKGVHYDAFYENIDLKDFLKNEVNSEDICIDLYARKDESAFQNRYLLTTKKLDYKIIKSYELEMKPHETNVFFDNYGRGIFLYDRKYAEINRYKENHARIMYDLAGNRPRKTIIYAIRQSILEHRI